MLWQAARDVPARSGPWRVSCGFAGRYREVPACSGPWRGVSCGFAWRTEMSRSGPPRAATGRM
ncbi:hypothetical protein GCM10023107_24690 [Actinoplanes octamycinicus]|nr:hypothetical protein Aoc01nite_58210 [Actinoplanes octamycinicus]